MTQLFINNHSMVCIKGYFHSFLVLGLVSLMLVSQPHALAQATTPEEKKAATADTYARKVTELRHAMAFEQNHSKQWILTRYLNIAFFGDQSYGVQAAARHYFSVDAKDLNLQQAAMLAGLVKNPNEYNPKASKTAALSRRNRASDPRQAP